MLHYTVIFLAAIFLAFIISPFVIKLAFRVGAVDIPKDNRRIHNKPMPRMGGFAIYISFLFCSLFFLKLDKQVMGIIIGGTIVLLMGIVDDIKQLKALPKLSVQILAAVV